MLCLNCDHPLPDDAAAACPGCGARRLELLAAPVAAPAPRRRRRGWGVVALLLCAAVVAGLAGQATLSHPSDPPTHAAPHKAKAHTAHAPRPAPTTSDPTTDPAPDPQIVLVALGSVPDGAPDPEGVLAAARAAMGQWSGQGLDLQESDSGSADVGLRFVADASDAGDAQRAVGIVPLGDRACGSAWSAYTLESVQALAARALGQAMGRDGPAGPGELMDPNLKPVHADGCATGSGSLAIGRGQSDGKSFRLGAAATVSYTMQSQDGYLDACLLTPQEWDSFAAGEGIGEACEFSSQSGSNSAALQPGDYILGFRCADAQVACHVDYTLAAQQS